MATRAGGVWQCASAFSTCFRGGGGMRCSSSSRRGTSTSSQLHCQVDSEPALSHNTIKRKVAMWIGYVGTHYKGLQIQRSTAAGQTIEQELETAIFRAGGILESNFGSLEKIRWMRSSRTDKGVHSLSTVISFKMEVNQITWRKDDDGIEVADQINHFLPDTIRIFGIVPVNKSFDPRRGCCSRTYHYLLPAVTLGLTGNTCDEVVQQCLIRFQNILSSFVGHHPYHNYTVRSQYRKNSHVPRLKNLIQHDAMEEEGKLSPLGIGFEDDQFSDRATSELESVVSLSGTSHCLPEVPEKIELILPKIRWLHEPDMDDKIFSAHFRSVLNFTCGGLQMYQGLYFVKLSVHGESFMLHQIRKMIGTAIAIMRGVFPADIIPISLSGPCRVVLPLAPSDGLFLACNEFIPFQTDYFKPKDSDDLPRLKMSTRVRQEKEEFEHNVLLPHIVGLLKDRNADWNDWLESLEGGRIPDTELDNVREAWREWWLLVSKNRALKGMDVQSECSLFQSPDVIMAL